jgi:hypothetical protein
MSIAPPWPQCLAFFGTPLVIEPSPGQVSGDAGLLPIRQFDQYIGLTQAFAEALDDPRDPDLTEHTFLEMVRSRVYGILAGYEDQNDHDTLGHAFLKEGRLRWDAALDAEIRTADFLEEHLRRGTGAKRGNRRYPERYLQGKEASGLALTCAAFGYDTEGSWRSRPQSIISELSRRLVILYMPDYCRSCLSVS